MISKDLGIPITAEMIYNIRKRIILPGIKNSLLKTQLEKQDKKETKIQQPIISSSVQTKEDPKKTSKNPEKTDLGKTILNSKYQNADDEKKANPFDDLLNKYDI
ncbi:hypothetical protein QNI19_31935 [Cytophagaceae bacterium DM2B3-1]|uniref:Uncharacterized protein n=1 Tax=Xanthocytophaga flava TaxID=3048013 RepID=A0ABT7CUZ3_9BACT|nr:hypothetical protein [Xanthocytophaga flavus]MDJ1497593.1 hypothetical protein [Xanthocytophaga flavus]